ncbi:MAG: hypothetical protein AB7T49_15840 [Oligoflexales bacterium]
MSRTSQVDILVELIELSREVMADIIHQLNYYRASVYKAETAQAIKDRISNLRLIVSLIDNDFLIEPFHDYDATVSNGNIKAVPGECIFSGRVTSLVNSLAEHLERYAAPEQSKKSLNNKSFANEVHKHRRQILSLCRHGSRQWSFFSSI